MTQQPPIDQDHVRPEAIRWPPNGPKGMDDYQRRKLDDIGPRRRMVELDYGSGKSWIVLEHAFRRHEAERDHSYGTMALVFCKKRNVITWAREIAKRHPQAHIFTDPVNQLLDANPSPDKYSVIILTHTFLRKSKHEQVVALLRRTRPRTVILDESTVIKNSTTQVAKASHILADLVRDILPETHILAMTGRMDPESVVEVWSQFAWVYGEHNPLGRTFFEFCKRWCMRTDRGWTPRLRDLNDLFRIVDRHTVAFDEDDQFEFEKTKDVRRQYVMEYYEPAPDQLKLMESLYDRWELPPLTEAMSGNGPLEFTSSLAVQQKANQVAGGFVYIDLEGNETECAYHLPSNPKAALLVDLLQQLFDEKSHRKIIVWSAYKHERLILHDILEQHDFNFVEGPDEEALLEFVADPNDEESSFEDPANIIIMPLGTSEGFNELVAADVAIFYSNVYSQEKRNQAEARIDRRGQESRTVTFIDLCSPHMADIEIVTALQGKDLTPERLNTIVAKYRKVLPQ